MLAKELLTRIEGDEEVSDGEVRALAAAVLEEDVVRLAMQVLAAKRPIMRAIELARAVLAEATPAQEPQGLTSE